MWCSYTEDRWPNIVQQYYLEFSVVFIQVSYKLGQSQLTRMKVEGSNLRDLAGASHWLNKLNVAAGFAVIGCHQLELQSA